MFHVEHPGDDLLERSTWNTHSTLIAAGTERRHDTMFHVEHLVLTGLAPGLGTHDFHFSRYLEPRVHISACETAAQGHVFSHYHWRTPIDNTRSLDCGMGMGADHWTPGASSVS